MDCHEVSDLLSAYIDGELDPAESRSVTNHLSACGQCRKELFELKQTIDLLHELPDLTPPADFYLRVTNKIKAEHKKRPWYAVKSRQWFSFGAVAAAVLLFVVSANVISPLKNLPIAEEAKTEMAADSSLMLDEQKPELGLLHAETLATIETSENADELKEDSPIQTGLNKNKSQDQEIHEEQTSSPALGNSLQLQNKASSKKSTTELLENNRVSNHNDVVNDALDNSNSNEVNSVLPNFTSNGDKDLKNRSTNYRGREDNQISLAQAKDITSTGLDYNISLHSEDSEQASREICRIVYSLGGNVLSDGSAFLEVAVPTVRLEVAFAAFKNQGIAEVRQVSTQDVNQAITYLKQAQEGLRLKIKELEREISRQLSSEKIAELEVKMNEYYADLKITQMRLKTIANGNTIVKIYFE